MRPVAMLLAVLALATAVVTTIAQPSHARDGDNACDRGSQSVLCQIRHVSHQASNVQ